MPVDAFVTLSRATAASLECWAVTAPGVERLAAAELERLGIAPGATEVGGVAFAASMAQLRQANLWLRTASRVVVRLASFHASTFHELERRARRVPWAEWLAPGTAAEFSVTSHKSKLYHQRAIAERLAGAAGGGAPPGDGVPVQLFLVRLVHDEVTLSIDSSGALLHQRGYRLEGGKAPLRETLAAALLLASGWDGTTPLVDPFCGSGTIPIEAALLARRIPPGLHRAFAFERWPGHDAAAWEVEREAARAAIRACAEVPIVGRDRDAGAVAAARANAARAGVEDDVDLAQASVSALAPPAGPGHVVTNPPYGVRIGDAARLRDLYARLGQVLRARCAGWTLTLLGTDRRLTGALGIPLTSRLLTSNGGVRVQLLSGRVGAAKASA